MRQQIDDDARSEMRMYFFECFRRMGKDLNKCEQCGVTDKKLDIHHTKYDGATVYDLQLVCRSCNLTGVNRSLV